MPLFIQNKIIRIINGCELRIENDVKVNCSASPGLPNEWCRSVSLRDGNFNSHQTTIMDSFFVAADLNAQVSVHSSVKLPWVSCEGNSSYSFVPIFLKLCRGFLHGMGMCIWFGYNRYIIFSHFFHFVNLVIFQPQCIDSVYLVSAAPHTILYQSFWNFAQVFSMVWRCACGLDIILALFLSLFPLCELIFWPQILWKVYRQWVHLPVMWSRPCNGVEERQCQPII